MQYYRLIDPSPFGPVVIFWRRIESTVRVQRVLLSRPECTARQLLQRDFPGVQSETCEEIEHLAGLTQEFLAGEPVLFSLRICDLDSCSPFQKQVLEREFRVPRGEVISYGDLARAVGRPGAARAVGHMLAGNPFPLIVPCHRTIRSDGTTGQYQGGPRMKQKLLRQEGIQLTNRGRVIRVQRD